MTNPTDSLVNEDITAAPVPNQISFRGYTTKNLHYSVDARKAFASTIKRAQAGLIPDGGYIKRALKATDAYMGVGDLHLQQNRGATPEEVEYWKANHNIAKRSLAKIGEFMHHLDYWNSHLQELQMLQANKNPNNQLGEQYMRFSSNPFQDILDEAAKWRRDDLEGKTWRSKDWDDGEMSPDKIQIDRAGKDVDDDGDELNRRPGAWRGKSDMSKRMTKKGVPTKSEKAFQGHLKTLIKFKGGLTGPKGNLPEEVEDNIEESMISGADRYEYAHGKRPSGKGTWIFSPHKSHSFKEHGSKAGEHFFQSAPHTSYSDAKKQASAWGKSKGHSELHVQT